MDADTHKVEHSGQANATLLFTPNDKEMLDNVEDIV